MDGYIKKSICSVKPVRILIMKMKNHWLSSVIETRTFQKVNKENNKLVMTTFAIGCHLMLSWPHAAKMRKADASLVSNCELSSVGTITVVYVT